MNAYQKLRNKPADQQTPLEMCITQRGQDVENLEKAAAELDALRVERDEAVQNANTYRVRVFDFLNGMIVESQHTQDIEESRGLEPVDREQFRNAVAYIKQAFERHNYATEAALAGVLEAGQG